MIIRWKCGKCNEKWIYPVRKCAFCKGNVEKQIGTKMKVIGFTRIMVPSPMHPIVPYNVLILEDENRNRMPRKTMKDYKIGDDFIVEKAKTEDAVAVSKIKYDIYEAVKESFYLLKDVKISDEKILVKPSVISAAYPYQAINTSPAVLDAVLKILLENVKKENIIVAESISADAASKSGILEVCKSNEIEFKNISEGLFEPVEIGNSSFNVYKEAVSRKIVNIPVMKSNFQLGISGAMENLIRLCDDKTQKEIYQKEIEKMLPKLANFLKNTIIVGDASNGMQGTGPFIGEPAFLNLIIASKNAASADAAFSKICMTDIPQYISNSIDVKKIEVVGSEIDALKFPVKKPVENETMHPDIKVIDGKACPKCVNLLYEISSKLIGIRGKEIYAAIGMHLDVNALKEKERVILLGDCAGKKFGNMDTGIAIIDGDDDAENFLLMKKVLMAEGKPKITNIDRVKTKIQKLLTKVK